MAVLYENGNIRTVQFGCKSTISRPTICTIGFSSQKIIEGTGSVVNSDHPSDHKPNDCGQGDLRLTREGGGGSGVVGSYTITAAPVTQGVSGQRGFFTDQSGVIRADPTGSATASSTPLS